MATFQTYRTARTPKTCDDYPGCERGIQPGERYLRASATPHDDEVNQGPHWWTLTICCEHMMPEPDHTPTPTTNPAAAATRAELTTEQED